MVLGRAQVDLFTVNVPYSCGVLHSTFAQKFLKITLENGKVPHFLPHGEANHVSMGTDLFPK